MKSLPFVLIGILMIASIGVLNFGDAFAEHVEYKTRDEMEKMNVKIFFVTSFDECSRNNFEALEGYSSMTSDILWKYNIDTSTSTECINADRISFAVDNSLSSYDLVIIIPDLFKSLEWLTARGIGGHYLYNGNDKAIVTEALTLNADSTRSAWILSHELAHFALDWYDYPISVFGDGVHTRQTEYDDCMWTDPTGAYCRDLWELVESVVTEDVGRTMGVKYHVMEPLYTERNPASLPVSISVWTDKTSYQYGNVIKITGKVTNFKVPNVIIAVYDSSGNSSQSIYAKLNNQGEFSIDIKNNFSVDGKYQVFAFHQTYSGSVSFSQVTPTVSSQPPSNPISQTTKLPSNPVSQTPQPQSSYNPKLERFDATNFRIAENVNSLKTFEEINFVINLRNTQNIVQPYVFLVQIQDSKGVTVKPDGLFWVEDVLNARESHSTSLSWTPSQSGTYTASAFLWEGVDNPSALFPPLSLKFSVSEGTTSNQQSIPQQVQPKESPKVYPTTSNSDNGITWEYAYSEQSKVNAKFIKIQDRIEDLWEIYDYQINPVSKQKYDNAISRMNTVQFKFENSNKFFAVGLDYMIQEKYSKAVSVFQKVIVELNTLENQELPNAESLVNEVIKENKFSSQKSNPTVFDNIPTGLVNTKNIQPKTTCGAGTELVNGKCQVIVDEPKSKSSWFDNIPTGLVDTKNVKPEKTCFLWWCW